MDREQDDRARGRDAQDENKHRETETVAGIEQETITVRRTRVIQVPLTEDRKEEGARQQENSTKTTTQGTQAWSMRELHALFLQELAEEYKYPQ